MSETKKDFDRWEKRMRSLIFSLFIILCELFARAARREALKASAEDEPLLEDAKLEKYLEQEIKILNDYGHICLLLNWSIGSGDLDIVNNQHLLPPNSFISLAKERKIDLDSPAMQIMAAEKSWSEGLSIAINTIRTRNTHKDIVMDFLLRYYNELVKIYSGFMKGSLVADGLKRISHQMVGLCDVSQGRDIWRKAQYFWSLVQTVESLSIACKALMAEEPYLAARELLNCAYTHEEHTTREEFAELLASTINSLCTSNQSASYNDCLNKWKEGTILNDCIRQLATDFKVIGPSVAIILLAGLLGYDCYLSILRNILDARLASIQSGLPNLIDLYAELEPQDHEKSAATIKRASDIVFTVFEQLLKGTWEGETLSTILVFMTFLTVAAETPKSFDYIGHAIPWQAVVDNLNRQINHLPLDVITRLLPLNEFEQRQHMCYLVDEFVLPEDFDMVSLILFAKCFPHDYFNNGCSTVLNVEDVRLETVRRQRMFWLGFHLADCKYVRYHPKTLKFSL